MGILGILLDAGLYGTALLGLLVGAILGAAAMYLGMKHARRL